MLANQVPDSAFCRQPHDPSQAGGVLIHWECSDDGIREDDTVSEGPNRFLRMVTLHNLAPCQDIRIERIAEIPVEVNERGWISHERFASRSASLIFTKKFLGAAGSSINQCRMLRHWRASQVFSAAACLYWQLEYDAVVFPSGIPSITAWPVSPSPEPPWVEVMRASFGDLAKTLGTFS